MGTNYIKITNSQIEAWFDAQQKAVDFYSDQMNTASSDNLKHNFVVEWNHYLSIIEGASNFLKEMCGIEMVYDVPGYRRRWLVLTPYVSELLDDYYLDMEMDAECDCDCDEDWD